MDIARAKELIKAAGVQGKTITIGTTQEIENLATSANIVRQAAEQIGLNVQIKSVSAANFINFFTDAKARAGIDMFPTVNYPDYGDPAGLYNTFALPGGSQNFDNYSNPQITKLLGWTSTPLTRFAARCRPSALGAPPGEWVRGWGLDYNVFEQTGISAEVIDQAVGGAPAALTFMDFHTLLASSADRGAA